MTTAFQIGDLVKYTFNVARPDGWYLGIIKRKYSFGDVYLVAFNHDEWYCEVHTLKLLSVPPK